MIVRTTNDPAAWRDLGPWQPEPFIPEEAGGVESAWIDPATIPASAPVGRRIAGMLSRTDVERAAARRRGSEATARKFRHRKAPDEAVLAALRATGGNVRAAGRLAGISQEAMNQRLTTLDRLGLLPNDVFRLVEARKGAVGRPRKDAA